MAYSELAFELVCKFTPSELKQLLHDLEVEFGTETKELVGV